MCRSSERGIALIMTLVVMVLLSAIMVGFTAVVMSDQRFRGIDRDRQQAFYAAHSGLEKMTADLGGLFNVSVAPSSAQLTAIQALPPAITGVTFQAADGTSGYTLTAQAPFPGIIESGSSPWAGLRAIKTIYVMESTARTEVGGEVHLSRRLETVAIPVFQFGIFSSVDLSFFAGPNFNFGGRVHTNGNLFLAEGGGATLTLNDKVTAFKEIVRQRLSNGASIDTNPGHDGTISMVRTGAPRNLERNEGSVDDTVPVPPGSLNGSWTAISKNTYNGWILNKLTGAKELNLPILNSADPSVVPAVTNIDLVKRPRINEAATNPTLLAERLFSKVSVRILLSDTLADFVNLPGLDTSKPPVSLEGNWNTTPPAGYGPVDASHPPIARSPGVLNTQTTLAASTTDTTISVASIAVPLGTPTSFWYSNQLITCAGNTPTTLFGCSIPVAIPAGSPITNNVLSAPDTGLVGGFIKIERQNNFKVWQDVTLEMLNLGIAGRNLAGDICADPTPAAIIRLQRLRDNTSICDYAGSTSAADYWPNTLFDPREGLVRDTNPGTTNVILGGVMHYVAIDAGNLSRWFQGLAPYNPVTADTANNDGGAGFSVYFSDRRNNRNAANQETGEYGFEDTVNSASGTGAPDGSLETGEDVNEDAVLDIYGQIPSFAGATGTAVPGAVSPLDVATRPWTFVAPAVAQANRAILFRRALKLVNGEVIVRPGLTIVAENPVYLEGNWNASPAGFVDPHAATSIIADAVTMLAPGWSDARSYSSPYSVGGRNRGDVTYVRAAVIAGKGPSFPRPAGTATDFGTDGGAHNFLRHLENGNQPVNYRGSLVTFYYSRQATGSYKCCSTVYGAPTRNYVFDIDFINPALLPPLTPVFRDVNTLGFSQELRPGK